MSHQLWLDVLARHRVIGRNLYPMGLQGPAGVFVWSASVRPASHLKSRVTYSAMTNMSRKSCSYARVYSLETKVWTKSPCKTVSELGF